MLKFSFLIPVYNGEQYLPRLLQSLLSQDISQSEYEIVFVDDCSQDKSVELLEQYQNTYSNIRLLKNKVNSKIATNVNLLVATAKGEYIWILGQDDYIESNCLGKLYKRLAEDQLDVLVFNYKLVSDDERVIAECRVVSASSKRTGIEWIKSQFASRDYCQYILGYTWRAVYRTDFWRENGIRSTEGMMYEDTLLLLKSLVYSKAVASIKDMLHNYRSSDTSISREKDHMKRGELIYEFAFGVGQEVEDFYNELQTIDTALAVNLHAHLFKRYNNFVLDLIRTPNEYKKPFYNLICENRAFVQSKRHYLNWKSRILTNNIIGYPISYE